MSNLDFFEIHFWTWDLYNGQLVFDFIKYWLSRNPGISSVNLSYLKWSIEDFYWHGFIEDSDFMCFEHNWQWLHIDSSVLNEIIVTWIVFRSVLWDSFFHVRWDKWKLYYSVSFLIENADMNDDELYNFLFPIYIKLIDIFNPVVSNAGFEILWEDSERIIDEHYFEWLFWYLRKDSWIDFIKYQNHTNLDNGVLFIKDSQ